MLTTLPLPNPKLRENDTVNPVQRIKLTLQEFNQDERGMNTVEAIILLFVAAVVLVVFFTFIWPLIRDSVYSALESLFGQTGR